MIKQEDVKKHIAEAENLASLCDEFISRKNPRSNDHSKSFFERWMSAFIFFKPAIKKSKQEEEEDEWPDDPFFEDKVSLMGDQARIAADLWRAIGSVNEEIERKKT